MALAILALLAGCRAPAEKATPLPIETAQPVPSATVVPAREAEMGGFRIVAYVLDGVASADSTPYDELTHINYAFVIPKDDGSLYPLGAPGELGRLAEAAHQHGVKVLPSVGGWGRHRPFERLSADPAARARFVGALVELVDKYKLDGVDIDWEYPQAGRQSQDFAALMQELGAAMHGRGKLLTAAVPAEGPNADPFPAEVFAQVDFLNIMAYDGPGLNHSSYDYAVDGLDYWLGRGLPPGKAVLGVPFYGKPGDLRYSQLVQVSATAPFTDQVEYNRGLVYYNGIPTMQAKTRLARERGAGIMIWTLSYDALGEFSLLAAINRAARGEARSPSPTPD